MRRTMRQAVDRRSTGMLACLVLLGGLALIGHGGWIHVKGWLGQHLMARSFAAALEQQRAAEPPWPGARARPVARLVVPALDIDRLVLDGIELPKLAWGPGTTAGERGHRVIAGHRDTHFRFLGDLAPGQRLSLQPAVGRARDWEVIDRRIVDSRTTAIDLDAPGPLLSLLTCYPLDGHRPGTPFRLIVRARPIDDADAYSEEAVAWAR
ncbi:sortase [Wenzhouxiangella sp. XN79A]|uniref:sortase domain-containing protein n=1 Tax=Wenzhouxiangella sp. XN79A TaxID=2724193 RepID=UPI00144A53C1|nr:sortase [Wenzhouxiangella sp. XN79A]NKI34492.1 sortase [Wenzhouxiangella sp. XN79A]